MPVTVYEFRDLDLMLRLREISDSDGWATSAEMAEALGFADDGASAIAPRLSWMRRYGMLAFDDEGHRWRLSAGGERVTKAQLSAAGKRTIEAVPDDAIIEVVSHVASRYRLGDPLHANLLRREFMYGTGIGQTGRR